LRRLTPEARTAVGDTVDEAAYMFSALENQCRLQLMVEAAAANGIPKQFVTDEDAAFTAKTVHYYENTFVSTLLLPSPRWIDALRDLNGCSQFALTDRYTDFQVEYELLLEETSGRFLK
jgi:hypothetical protein